MTTGNRQRGISGIAQRTSRLARNTNNMIIPGIVEDNEGNELVVRITLKTNVETVVRAVPVFALGSDPLMPEPGTHVMLLTPYGDFTLGSFAIGRINI